MAQERVQKILARAGVASRRACEQLIAAGRVQINGSVIELGAKADPSLDDIRLDGRRVSSPQEFIYIALNKPRGVVSTARDEAGRKTVLDLVPLPQRVYPVGRLDLDSEGLILLTNDGALTERLTHPRYGHEKEYRVLLARHPDRAQIETWQQGVVLEDGDRTAPAEVYIEKRHGKGAWLRVILREGRKRQIRRVASRLGLPVVRIVRTRIGALELENLKPGRWRHLKTAEVAQLKKQTED